MHLDGDDSRMEELTASSLIIDKGKTILVENSGGDGDSQVTPIDVLANVDDVPALEPIDMFTTFKASGIDCLLPLLLLLHWPCM